MRLLLLNALKGLRKKKVQMFGITMMILLSTGIYVAMNTALDRLENRYYHYLEEQNVEDISLGVKVDYEKDVALEDIEYLEEHQFAKITLQEKQLLELYKQSLKEKTKIDINLIKMLFMKYSANEYIENKLLKSLSKKYDFSYQLEESKTLMEEDKLIKVMPYLKDKKINKTYLIEGNYPTRENEITMLPKYAASNGIKIGDNYKVGKKEYKVVGFTYAPDYIYPLITFSTPIFDEKKNNIIFVNKKEFETIKAIDDNTYSIDYNDDVSRKFEIKITDEGKAKDKDKSLNIFEDEKVELNLNTITRVARIGALQLEFASNRLFADYFLYLLLAIAVVVIVIITKKRIDDERLQIGVLKSLGYNPFSIAVSYLVYPIIGSIIGGILGYMIGSIIHYPMTSLFLSYYNVPLENFQLNLNYLKTAIMVPMIMLSTLCYLIAIFMLRKKPLALLREGSNLKVNIFSKIINKITGLLPFDYRFKYSLAFRSLGKLFIVAITSFATGLLIVLTLIGANLFDSMIEKSFEGTNYNYTVLSKQITSSKENDKDDYVLSVNSNLDHIEDKNGKVKKLEQEDNSITLTGIDVNNHYTKLINLDSHDITKKLKGKNGVIVNENFKEIYSLELEDTLVLEINNKEVKYKIIGFSSELFGFSAYVEREELSKKLGFDKKVYNQIHSNQKKYSNMSKLEQEELENISYIMSTKELRENIEKQMDRFDTSIYIVILFSSFMAFIIIAVIASIVVEENKKIISLMKVMGYNNKKISRIVLNIYTPFVIIAYLLSIPCMTKLLKWIVNLLVGDMEVTIPITLSPLMAMIGLIGLLIAYYVAIAIAKRSLNKIPLAIALKRE